MPMVRPLVLNSQPLHLLYFWMIYGVLNLIRNLQKKTAMLRTQQAINNFLKINLFVVPLKTACNILLTAARSVSLEPGN